MVNQVIIEVTYDGQWQGAIVQQGSMESWSGTGYKGKSVQRPPSGEWIISFNAQKMDGSSKKLTVRITTLEGEVLKEASTTSPYGIAQLSVKIA